MGFLWLRDQLINSIHRYWFTKVINAVMPHDIYMLCETWHNVLFLCLFCVYL